MPSPFLTKPELKKITCTDNVQEQIRILRDKYGVVPFGDEHTPVVYRDVMLEVQRNNKKDVVDMNLDALDAQTSH